MTIMQEISREIGELTSGNDLYNQYAPRWKFLLEAYLGGDEYRQGCHLTRYQLETNAEYQARLAVTPYDNHPKSVVSVYNSFLFRKEPDREYGSMTGVPEVKDFLKDADLEGRSLDAFMKDVATWSAVFGHCWIIMAKPDVGAITRADEIVMGARPYVSLLTPLTVLDWSWVRSPNGRYELDYLRYLEEVNGDVKTVKEWTKETIRTIVADTKENIKYVDETVPNGLGMIPAVIAYNSRSTVRGIGISAISDIADMAKFIYNATSEVDQSIRLDSHPSLVKTPETQAGVGAGAIIQIPENMDPGLKPYVLDFAGANINNIYASINHSIAAIDKMANTGAVRSTTSSTLSGVAMETEFQLLNAKLSEMADNLELAEEQMWRIFAMYQGYPYDMEIEYPSSFNVRDTSREIDNLVKARSAATDPKVIALIDHELIEFLGEDADLLMPEVVTLPNAETVPFDSAEPFEETEELFNPVDGETRWVNSFEEKRALMKQGWVEE